MEKKYVFEKMRLKGVQGDQKYTIGSYRRQYFNNSFLEYELPFSRSLYLKIYLDMYISIPCINFGAVHCVASYNLIGQNGRNSGNFAIL